MHTQQPVNAVAAADASIAFRGQLASLVGSVHAAEQPPPSFPVEPQSVVTSTPMVATTAEPTPSIDWPCVAVAETGADWTMHGSTYSTAYGVVNDIVYDYASPEVAARVFVGTASEAEQTDIVVRFAADHGTGGWGELTKQKCGL